MAAPLSSNITKVQMSEEKEVELETSKKLSGASMAFKHIVALEIKKFHHAKRNKKGWLCEVG